MSYLKLNLSDSTSFLEKELIDFQDQVTKIHEMIHDKTGLGSEFLGWVNLPLENHEKLIGKLNKAGAKIRQQSQVLVVIGIGGSYLGAQAGLDFLMNEANPEIEIIFAGHQISGTYLKKLVSYLENKDFSINVISKSGTTTEPAIAFRILKQLLEQKYPKNAKDRIFVTTDKSRGALFQLATKEGYEKFVIPDDVGGRFSVLTPVGLLPFAAAGYDIKKMLNGANHAAKRYLNPNLLENEAYQYAVQRYLHYLAGKKVEVITSYNYELAFFGEWWKQLYGESEGKDHQGLFVASTNFTTDLHSLGQFLQDGTRILIETVLHVENIAFDLKVPETKDDLDNLNYLAHKNLSYINTQAMLGTNQAHVAGGVPVTVLTIPELNEYSFGYLVFFFEKACAMSAYLLGVNPFNQPGVELYKQNMFKLLGKPGYEL